MKLLTIFEYSIVYIKYTSRRNDFIDTDGIDLNSSKQRSLQCFLIQNFISIHINCIIYIYIYIIDKYRDKLYYISIKYKLTMSNTKCQYI